MRNENQHKIEVGEMTRNLQEERERAVREAKSNQWCANCQKEAMFYCCWNTSYCDHRCQEHHWPKHQKTCAQIQQANADSQNESPSVAAGSSSQIPPNATYRPMPMMGSRWTAWLNESIHWYFISGYGSYQLRFDLTTFISHLSFSWLLFFIR